MAMGTIDNYKRSAKKDAEAFMIKLVDTVVDEPWNVDLSLYLMESLKAYGTVNNLKVGYQIKRDTLLSSYFRREAKPFLLWLMEKAPNVALYTIRSYGGQMDYLHQKEIVSYLSPVGYRASNLQRRRDIVAGGTLPSFIEHKDFKGFINKQGRENFPYNAPKWYFLSPKQRRMFLRLGVLQAMATKHIEEIKEDSPKYKPRAIRNLARCIKNYPDILDIPYDIEGKTVADFVFSLDRNTMVSVLSDAIKQDRIEKGEGGTRSVKSVGYKLSPEELIWYAINKNPESVPVISERFANVFVVKKRQEEYIDNIVKIAVNNSKYLDEIILPFVVATTYASKDEIVEKLLKEAIKTEEKGEAFVKALALHIDLMPEELKKKRIKDMEDSLKSSIDDAAADSWNMLRLEVLDRVRCM